MVRLLVLALLGSLVTGSHVLADPPRKALLVGNSYLSYNGGVASHLDAMLAESLGEPPDASRVTALTRNNGRLRDQAVSAAFDTSMPPDLVVLQGHSTAAESPDNRDAFVAGVARAIAALPPSTRIALYVTPAYHPRHARYRPDMLRRTETLYRQTARSFGAQLVPVGAAFAEAQRRFPDIELHVPGDWSHPTPEGTYLATAVTLAAVWRVSPLGLLYDMDGRVDGATAMRLQAVAADVAGFGIAHR